MAHIDPNGCVVIIMQENQPTFSEHNKLQALKEIGLTYQGISQFENFRRSESQRPKSSYVFRVTSVAELNNYGHILFECLQYM